MCHNAAYSIRVPSSELDTRSCTRLRLRASSAQELCPDAHTAIGVEQLTLLPLEANGTFFWEQAWGAVVVIIEVDGTDSCEIVVTKDAGGVYV